MTVIICLCAAIPLLALILSISLQYSKRGRLLNKIPGPPPLPIFGNLLLFAIPIDDVWPKIRNLFVKYSSIFRIWGFWYCAVFMCHPEDLKVLLSCKKNINKCHVVYDILKHADCHGLITSGGERWQHRRKILNYAFTSNLLEVYSEKINKRASRFVAELTSRGDVFVENIVPLLLKFALGAVCGKLINAFVFDFKFRIKFHVTVKPDAVMDFDTDNMSAEKEKEFRDAVNELFDITLYRTFRPYILDFMMPFLPVGRRLSWVSKKLNSFRRKIIEERRKYHASEGHNIFEMSVDQTKDNITNTGVKGLNKKLAVIDLLLFAEKKELIDDHGIAEETLTIVGAGYETTGMAMAFLLALLAENKEQQDLARAEILESLGDDNCVTLNHVKKMTYLERCVKEALRLFPTAPHIGRVITNELRLSEHTLPTGTLAFISLHDLQRDCHFWSEPDKFDPDRFLPENVKKRHPFAYLPFSTGPRNCIGQKLATAEMRLVTAHILYNFYLEPVDLIADLKLEMHFTIKVGRLNLKFVRINRN